MNILVDKKIGKVTFSLSKTLWLYFILLPLIFIDFSKMDLKIMLITLAMTFFTVCIGHSIGLHRGVIHKSYTSSKLFRNISLYLFVLTGLGSPLSWMRVHYFRDYWQNRLDCPNYFAYQHSLFKDYWWNLHLQFSPNDIEKYNIPQLDLNNKWIKWLDKTWYIHNILLILIVFFITNLNTTLIIMFFRIAITILGHWYIGYVSHKYGYSKFAIQDANESGYNNIILGLISFGEGLHNNHHAHPRSAKFSNSWYEIDIGWYVIKILKYLNIVSEVLELGKSNTIKHRATKTKLTQWKYPW